MTEAARKSGLSLSLRAKQLRVEPPRWTGSLDTAGRGALELLVRHPSVRRTSQLLQLGFAQAVFPNASHTRWDHALASMETLNGLTSELATNEVRTHILAACLLQEIGHAPFSNSLNRTFPHITAGSPDSSDISRALSMLGDATDDVRRLGLDPNVLATLIAGRTPWPGLPWIASLLDGPIDIDRLTYLRQDAERTGVALRFQFSDGLKWLRPDPRVALTVVDTSGVPFIEHVIRLRARLYATVYLAPQKIALEFLVQKFLQETWSAVASHESWSKPATVEEFRDWTDEKVVELVSTPSGDGELEVLRRQIVGAEFIVADVLSADERDKSFSELDALLTTGVTQGLDNVWALTADEVPRMEVHRPGRILVRERQSRYVPIEERSPGIRALPTSLRRRPLILFPRQLKDRTCQALGRNDLKLGRSWYVEWIKTGA